MSVFHDIDVAVQVIALDEMKMEWIDSNGGPLIAMPHSLIRHWDGSSEPRAGRVVEAESRWNDPDAAATDYDRACDVSEYVEAIRVGDGQALVFGDEPMSTCFVPEAGGGCFVRWCCAPSADAVAALLSSLPSTGFEVEVSAFTISRGSLLLFDSAYSGEEMDGEVGIDLPSGDYDVATRTWEPDEETSLVLHRLTRRGL